jgi:uncharacterized membrane-anchored protein
MTVLAAIVVVGSFAAIFLLLAAVSALWPGPYRVDSDLRDTRPARPKTKTKT